LPPNAGGQPPSGNRRSLLIVLAILAVLLVIAGGIGVYAVTSDGDQGEASSEGDGGDGVPTAVIPTDELPTGDVPSDLPTDELPSDLTDLPELPTEGGPSEEQYVDVATSFVVAARDGDCDAARKYANQSFNSSVSDANLCEGITRSALQDDDFDDYEIEFFGTYGALVTFDDGQTNVSLVSGSGDPTVQFFIAF
jgi:hypothetical protein